MEKKATTGMMLTLVLTSMLTLIFSIQRVKADWTLTETIYIRADGSVYPDAAPISTVDNITYTLTDNIVGAVSYPQRSAIVVERDNIAIDGAGFKIQRTEPRDLKGVDLTGRSNVTIKNVRINSWTWGIYLDSSSNNNYIHGNIFASTWASSIWLDGSSSNIIFQNCIGGEYDGIVLKSSDNNSIYGNEICCYNYGIALWSSSGNRVSENTAGCANIGFYIIKSSNNDFSANTLVGNAAFDMNFDHSSSNSIYHNNFIACMHVQCYGNSTNNIWDDGFPSGGNYWSDYEDRYPDATELDGSGIWDTPYVIDENNQDSYPLVEPWSPAPPAPTTIDELKTKVEELSFEGEIDNHGIVKSLIAKLNVAQKLVDKGKVDEAKSILEDDFIPQVQELSGIHTTVEAADILIESAEYIISHL